MRARDLNTAILLSFALASAPALGDPDAGLSPAEVAAAPEAASSPVPLLATTIASESTAAVQPAPTGEDVFNHRFSGEHQVALLSNGPAAFEARLRMIENAKSEIDIESYIFEPDTAGKTLLQALVAKKKQMDADGKPFRVRLLVDYSFLNHVMKSRYEPGLSLAQLDELRKAGIETKVFNPGMAPWHYNHRDHRKLFIVDGESFVTGGRNIQDRYFGFGSDPREIGHSYNYYDTDTYVRGPAATGAKASFDAYWTSKLVSNPKKPRQENRAESDLLEPTDDQKTVAAFYRAKGSEELALVPVHDANDVSFVTDKPEHGQINRRVVPAVNEMESSAQGKLLMENWIMLPTGKQKKVFDELLARGVSVDLLTNSYKSHDGALVYYLSVPKTIKYVHQGMNVFVLTGKPTDDPGVDEEQDLEAVWGTHAKVACVDDTEKGTLSTCFVGSANNDPRSAKINNEVGVIVHDNPAFAREVQASIEERKRDSFQLTSGGGYLGPIEDLIANGNDCIPDAGVSPLDDKNLRGIKFMLLKITTPLE